MNQTGSMRWCVIYAIVFTNIFRRSGFSREQLCELARNSQLKPVLSKAEGPLLPWQCGEAESASCCATLRRQLDHRGSDFGQR